MADLGATWWQGSYDLPLPSTKISAKLVHRQLSNRPVKMTHTRARSVIVLVDTLCYSSGLMNSRLRAHTGLVDCCHRPIAHLFANRCKQRGNRESNTNYIQCRVSCASPSALVSRLPKSCDTHASRWLLLLGRSVVCDVTSDGTSCTTTQEH